MIVELTGLDVANASLLDEATAAAEAMYMAHDLHKRKRKTFFVSEDSYPQTIDVIKTRAKRIGVQVIVGNADNYDFKGNKDLCGIFVQSPDKFGRLKDWSHRSEELKSSGAILVMGVDLLSATLSKSAYE